MNKFAHTGSINSVLYLGAIMVAHKQFADVTVVGKTKTEVANLRQRFVGQVNAIHTLITSNKSTLDGLRDEHAGLFAQIDEIMKEGPAIQEISVGDYQHLIEAIQETGKKLSITEQSKAAWNAMQATIDVLQKKIAELGSGSEPIAHRGAGAGTHASQVHQAAK